MNLWQFDNVEKSDLRARIMEATTSSTYYLNKNKRSYYHKPNVVISNLTDFGDIFNISLIMWINNGVFDTYLYLQDCTSINVAIWIEHFVKNFEKNKCDLMSNRRMRKRKLKIQCIN